MIILVIVGVLLIVFSTSCIYYRHRIIYVTRLKTIIISLLLLGILFTISGLFLL